MKKVSFVLSLFTLMLVSCGGNASSAGSVSSSSVPASSVTPSAVTSSVVDASSAASSEMPVSSSVATTYPLDITTYDSSSNEITQNFSKAPEKVVTNNLSVTETLVSLGLKDKIIGMMNLDNAYTGKYATEIDSITKLGDKKTVNKEAILAKEPDIVVGRCAMFTDKSVGTYTSLNEMDVNVYAQKASTSTATIQDIPADIRNLGKIFDVNDKAEEVAKDLETKISTILSKVTVDTTNYKKALVMCNYNDATFGAYKSALQENVLNSIGYTNVATGTSGLTLENLVTMDPEVIIYVTSDRNKSVDETAVENMKKNESISDVSAVKNDKIMTLTYDEFMDYGSPVIDSLEKIYDFIY